MRHPFLFICLFLALSTFKSFAQENLNAYKYIIVPKQYEFQKSQDQYQINSLTKFLFERAGFQSIFTEDNFPLDLADNPCLGLKAVVVNEKSFLSTKMYIKLHDCRNKVVYATDVSRSKEKDYKKAYHQAIRATFVAIDTMGYEYNELLLKKDKVTNVGNQEIVKKSQAENVESKKSVQSDTKNAALKKVVPSITGTFLFELWGECVISKNGDHYSVVGGDENFEFATITKTSKPNLFMIKRVGFKQTQLLELDEDGNLKMDTNDGVKIYKRVR